MKNYHSGVWVTSAFSGDEAKKCLVLAKALEASFTNRPTAIFITSGVESRLRSLLSYTFDHLYCLDEDELKDCKSSCVAPHDLAKVSVLKLTWFEKCVYLSPNTVVLGNADNVFNFWGDDGINGAAKILLPHEEGDGDLLPVFAVKPCIKAYRSAWDNLTTKRDCVRKAIESYFDEEEGQAHGLLDPMFCGVLGTGSFTNCDVSIATFHEDPRSLVAKNLGILGNLALNLWMGLYAENEASLEAITTSSSLEIEGYSKEPIAVVGMSCRYPRSNKLEDFWQVLIQGKDCIGEASVARRGQEEFVKVALPCGYLDIPLDGFDSKFFGISPKELVQMDPQHRLLHEVIWEALEDAAMDPLKLDSTSGSVFLGTWKNDFKDILTDAGYSEFYRKYMGNSIGAGAARISFHLGMTGPCIATESGCSSSMVAIHMACTSLRTHETSMALACGANLLLAPFDINELPTMLAPDGKCKTLDAKADGFGRAEGLGVVVLKRLSDAVRDNDRIWALIRGSAVAQEGTSKSLGTPTVQCQTLAMKGALRDAGVEPAQVSYVELHGTGTPTGDPVEVKAIANAYHSKNRKEPLLIASAKTNVGHTESCSGMTGLMKVALQMKYGLIAPHRNLEEINPEINLDLIPAKVPLEPEEWRQNDGRRRIAGVSSFGITGTDAHLIVEEGPQNVRKFVTDFQRSWNILKISAKSEEAFDLLLGKYLEYFRQSSGEEGMDSLENICYTGNVGRADFQFRSCLIGRTKQEIASILEKSLERKRIPDVSPKICFLFTGQDSQYPQMAKDLYDTCPVFRVHFDHCANILEAEHNINLCQVLWSDDLDLIDNSIYSETAIFAVEHALVKLWESWGITPDFCLGHSLGEFAASVCAGILSVEDALKLLASRSVLIEEQCPLGSMLVVRAPKSAVLEKMRAFAWKDSSKTVDFAAFNSDEETVVAGDPSVILDFARYLKTEGPLDFSVLMSTHAFHSKHMDVIKEDFAQIAATMKTADSSSWKCGYISGVRGVQLTEAKEIGASYWLDHLRQPVNFIEATRTAVKLGSTIFLEIGPQPIPSGLHMMNTDLPITYLPSLKRNEENWRTMLESLEILYTSGVEVNWLGLDKLYDRSKVSSLPTYPFIRKRFWPENISKLNKRIVHPLLGSIIPNATSTNIFQVGLNLDHLAYIKDHKIGDSVFYPAACFLETMLAAGMISLNNSESLTKARMALKLENFVIRAPLRLEEATATQIQTVAGDDGNDGRLRVQMFRKKEATLEEKYEGESSIWYPHATGTVVPFHASEEETKFDLDLDKFEGTKNSESSDSEGFYTKIGKLGLKFGDIFKNLEKLWLQNNEDGKITLAKVKLPPQKQNQAYILHPVIIDAMLQAILVQSRGDVFNKLHLPVRIGEFVWLAGENMEKIENDELYVHAYNSHSAVLLNSSGGRIAIMSDAEFLATSLPALNSILEERTSKLPTLWEEVWKGTRGTMQHRLNFDSLPERFFSQEFLQSIGDTINVLGENNLKTWKLLEKFVFLNVLKGMYDLGWEGEAVNGIISLASFVKSLGILVKHKRVVGSYFTILEKEGFLEKSAEAEWKVVKILPLHEDVEGQLESPTFKEELVVAFPSVGLLKVIGDNLARILRGERDPLQILFEDNLNDHPSMAQFYGEYFEITQGLELGSHVMGERLKFWKSKMGEDSKFALRILEIGAGTGTHSAAVLNMLEEAGTDYEFYYTDISSSFFLTAEKKFEKYRGKMRFQKLNIEEDPLDQGFLPEYFDYVLASGVIHATRDIRKSLGHVRKMLRNGGSFDIFEQTRFIYVMSYVFGSLDGFWRFEDYDLRPDHCTMSVEQWRRAFEESGYTFTQTFSSYQGNNAIICSQKKDDDFKNLQPIANLEKTWVVFKPANVEIRLVENLVHKLITSCSRRVVSVEPGASFQTMSGDKYLLRGDAKEDLELLMETLSGSILEGVVYAWALDKRHVSQSEILQPYLNIIQTLDNLKQTNRPRYVALTSGVVPNSEQNRINCHQSTLWGFTRSMKNEQNDIPCRCIDVQGASFHEIFHEIWNNDNETQICFASDNSRQVARLRPLKPSSNSLSLPKGTSRFQISLPKSRKISDLNFVPLDHFKIGSEQVEIEIRAFALNFRDIFAVLKPSDFFLSINVLGYDFAGVVARVGESVTRWRTGDRVFGLLPGVVQSHQVANESELARIPKEMSFCEAATLPLVFATAYTSLVHMANIQPEDIVLIHTASGGVGLACIDLCRHLGVPLENIICTVGSQKKRNFLKESYGIVNIFNSRTTEYSGEILKLTGGRGVNVVVNTLTSKGFKEATLECLAKRGHFIELSKLNVWESGQVFEMRPDVNYHFVDDSLLKPEKAKIILGTLVDLLETSEFVSPLPCTRFDGVDLRQAMDFLQKGKHVGKVVCVMPQTKRGQGLEAGFAPMFNENGTYLISGGLGGIGFQVAKWMLTQGAKHLLLLGRTSPKAQVQREIERLNEGRDGAHIVTAQLDVSNYSELEFLVDNLSTKQLPRLKGVMHCAGVLADGVIGSLDWSTFCSPLKSKVDGTLNLHRVTCKGKMRLEHFVLFSSVTSLLGTPSQSNYAAGNYFEDTFAHYRHSIGLPATTINWSAWAEVGLAAELDLPGFKGISNEQGMAALEYAMKSQRVQTCAMNVSSFQTLSKWMPQLAVYLEEKVWTKKEDGLGSSEPPLISNEFWNNYDQVGSIEEKRALIKDMLAKVLRNILKLDVGESIGEEDNFGDLGVDSLMFVEIRNDIQAVLGNRFILNVAVIRESDCLKELAAALMSSLDGDSCEIKATPPPSFDEINKIIEESCRLPQNIRATATQTFCPIGDVRRVLLTGATGTLGPYVLRELCNLPQISNVFCLVRSQRSKTARYRLNECLAAKGLLAQIEMSKVTVVDGDVSLSHFKLGDGVWKELTESCDAVFHCAARVDHVEIFSKTSKVGSVNIEGVKHVLEFACAGETLKHVYYASSVFAVGRGRSQNGMLSEEWPILEDFNRVTTFSYPISKFCGDMLLKEASVSRGIPCKSFRFPLVSGDSTTGQFTIDQNHLMLRYLYMMKTGIMPSLPFPLQLLPVDICAGASVQLFFNADAPPDLYNLVHPSPNTDEEFIGLANKFGKQIRMVEFAQFSETLRQERDDSSQITLFKEMYNEDELYLTQYNASLTGWMERREEFWRSEKLEKYMPGFSSNLKPTLEYMEQDLKFAVDKGWFERFGLL